jgi:MFS transporter, DHA3 family, macrolide efflux protein
MADPVAAVPEELRPPPEGPPERALALLGRRPFRRTYLAIAVSELGDAFQYVALMWVALVAGGPLGVLAVRLADSVPAFVFGLHGGLVADRWERKRTMVSADLVRAAVLLPVAAAGLSGRLPLWGLVLAAFVLTAAASYFEPAYGALLPTLVDRRNVQAANGLVHTTTATLSVAGWSVAAALLTFLPISAFFLLNAASFLVSALLLAGVRAPRRPLGATDQTRVREGFAALRPRPALAAAVAVAGIAVTISAGTWIVGVPTFVRDSLGLGAGSFSLVAAAYAVGSAAAGLVLARRHVAHKALGSLLAWTIYLAAYGSFALAESLPLALAGGAAAGLGQGAAFVLLYSAAQEEVPDQVLGRVVGLISLVHRGGHATGLLLVGPLFALFAPRTVFAAAALALPLVGLGGALVAVRASRGRSRTAVD